MKIFDGNVDDKLVIITDHKWKKFLYKSDLPKKVQEDFDWCDVDNCPDMFLKYNGCYYHIGDFIKFDGNYKSEFKEWHGIHTETFFSGVVIKVSMDGTEYQIGRYY